MAKKKLQIETLAKLRQFAQGMDPAVFLSTEWRQVTRALEQAHVNIDDPTFTTVGQVGNVDLYAVATAAFYMVVAAGIKVSLANQVLISGTITSDVFFPASNGKYFVDFGCEFFPGVAGTVTNYLELKNTAGTVIHELRANVDLSVVGGPKYVTGRAFVDLTTANGAWFNFRGDINTVCGNFYCSFTKVS